MRIDYPFEVLSKPTRVRVDALEAPSRLQDSHGIESAELLVQRLVVVIAAKVVGQEVQGHVGIVSGCFSSNKKLVRPVPSVASPEWVRGPFSPAV